MVVWKQTPTARDVGVTSFIRKKEMEGKKNRGKKNPLDHLLGKRKKERKENKQKQNNIIGKPQQQYRKV